MLDMLRRLGRNELTAMAIVAPPDFTLHRALDAATLLRKGPRSAAIRDLAARLSLSEAHFQRVYAPVLANVAVLLQELPLDHSTPENVKALDHVVLRALKVVALRAAYVLPPGGSSTALNQQQHVWTYAAFTATVLRDLLWIMARWHVTLADTTTPRRWNPWHGPLPVGTRYRYERVAMPPSTNTRPWGGALLARAIVPSEGMTWLAQEEEIFAAWQAVLYGDALAGGILWEIVARTYDEWQPMATPSAPPTRVIAPEPLAQIPPIENSTPITAPSLAGSEAISAPPSASATAHPATQSVAERFFTWLQQEITAETLHVNTDESALYRVAEGVLLVSPTLFQLYAAHSGNKQSWEDVQKRVVKYLKKQGALGVGLDGDTLLTYQRNGAQGYVRRGILISQPTMLGIEISLPRQPLARKTLGTLQTHHGRR